MFNKKRLEEQMQTINSLEEAVKNLQKEINNLKKENESLQQKIEQQEAQNKTSNEITLTEEQSEVIDLLENTNKNYFITGKAGTGKSTVLNHFRKTTRKKSLAVVAPTGAAALNVEGQTIHYLFRMDFEPQDTSSKSKVKADFAVLNTLKAINVLIIDEVSMVRADVMDMIDARLKLAKGSYAPFGGCQIIAFGDLYQLPPIATDRVEKDFIEQRYGTLFFFGAPGVKNTFKIVELKNVMRQKDQNFVQVLNSIRTGSVSNNDLLIINSRYSTLFPDESIRLTPTNEMANTINKQELAKLNSKEFTYETELGGNNPPAREDVPFDFVLKLKIGARVVMVKNDPSKQYVNGSMGTITKLSQDGIQVLIGNKRYNVEPHTWTKKVYKIDNRTNELISEIVGWAKQYPIKLAWAITIHKSQGQTYDSVIVDYSGVKAFAAGQTYVALSRCKTLHGLYLTRPLTKEDVHTDKQVLDYMNGRFVEPPVSEEHKRLRGYQYEKMGFTPIEDEYPF